MKCRPDLKTKGFKYILFAACIAAVLLFFSGYRKADNTDFQYTLKSDRGEFFLEAADNAYPFRTSLNCVGAGVCSHHLFMAEYISGFFKKLSEKKGSRNIKTFVIIGPNHYSRGRAVVAVTGQRWKTPFGFAENNSSITSSLIDRGFAESDPDAFTFEHSMGALIPFVKQFFPDASVVPIIIRHGFSEADAYRLGEYLADILDDSAFLLLSADFVHNKYSREILPIDKHTAEVMRNYYTHITGGRLPLLNMDCNRGLQVLMSFSARKKFTPDILLNTNSAIVSGRDVRATSYFFIYLGGM